MEKALSMNNGGCFTLHLIKKSKSPFGICLTPSFSVSQNTTSLNVLQEIQTFFNCGSIRKDRNTSKFEVRDLESLQHKIIPFFRENQLRTHSQHLLRGKKKDFLIFCEICQLMSEKQHFSFLGVLKLLDLGYSTNQNGVYLSHFHKLKMRKKRKIKID